MNVQRDPSSFVGNSDGGGPPTGREAFVIKWLWSILWRKKRSRRKAGAGVSILRWFTPGLTVTGVAASLLAVLTGQVNLPTLDRLRGTEPPVFDDPISASVGASPSSLQTPGSASGRVAGENVTTQKVSPVGLSETDRADPPNRSS